MPKTVTLRFMRYLGDGPDARPYDVVLLRRYSDGEALIGFPAGDAPMSVDHLDLAFTARVLYTSLTEIPD